MNHARKRVLSRPDVTDAIDEWRAAGNEYDSHEDAWHLIEHLLKKKDKQIAKLNDHIKVLIS